MNNPSYLGTLKRSYRNWQRKRNRVLATELPAPFFHAKDINAVNEYFSACGVDNNSHLDSLPSLSGQCYICDETLNFKVDLPVDGSPVNWRETLVCPKCGLINRWRSCLHVFDVLLKPATDDRIYLTETLSPVYQNLAARYPFLSASEYFPDKPFGQLVKTDSMPVRNEDVTKLTFEDSSLEAVLCFDVLEHVPDYRSALKEFYRVLNSGGQLLISVPFSFTTQTRVRARQDAAGHIEHLCEPCYHGDPLSDQGVLSYYDFGTELLGELREAGFQECFLVCYYSEHWAYLNENVVFVARKLKSSVNSRRIAKLIWQNSIYLARYSVNRFASWIIATTRSANQRVSFLLNSHSFEYNKKMQSEKSFFKECTEVHNLPDIFHYWSNKFLAPDMCRFGFSNPEEFFAHNIKCFMAERIHQKIHIVSIGSGNCDLEVKISQKLVQWGFENFVFECVDINKDMLKRGSKAANDAGLADSFLFSQGDFNNWRPAGQYEIIMANQSLHHVLNLEDLFDSIKKSLQPEGLFLVSDMIGRNGHMRWPEAIEELRPFWNELPKNYRHNRLLNRYEEQYINHDCSTHGFEGIRAQDILPLLTEHFSFKFFYPFGNLIFVFIDRPFGHGFNANAQWDRDFIDRVHARDEACMISGELKPTSMLAVLTRNESETVLRHPALTPQHCLRSPDLPGSNVPAGTPEQRLTGKG